MSAPIIKRIDQVKGYRGFVNWQPGSNTHDFEKVNLVYGQNGGGKSTLTDLMRACHAEEPLDGVRFAVDVQDGASAYVRKQIGDQDLWGRLRIFDKHFIADNIDFDRADGPAPAAIVTVGEQNVEADRQIAELSNQHKSDLAEREELQKAVKKHERDGEKRATGCAKSIGDRLAGSGLPDYGPRSYTRTQVERMLRTGRRELAGASDDIDKDIAAANSKAVAPIEPLAEIEPDALQLPAHVRELLARSVISNSIDALVGHADRSAWVQQGMELHRELDTCLFCDHRIEDARRRQLAAHFSDAVHRLQRDVDGMLQQLESVARKASASLSRLPHSSAVYDDLAPRLVAAEERYEKSVETFLGALAGMRALLEQKRSDPLSPVDAATVTDLVLPDPDPINAVIEQHNQWSAGHHEHLEQAARRVELALIAQIRDDWDVADKAAAAGRQRLNELDQALAAGRDRIAELESTKTKPLVEAATLTQRVRDLLGPRGLEFRTHDSSAYDLLRDGAPATHLSEGERTAIALTYFLASVQQDVDGISGAIVVVDDPVSSMDDSIMYGASSMLWTGLVESSHIAQMFVLTHQFEFFREWAYRLRSHRWKKDSSIHELRMRLEPNLVRLPDLVRWPDGRKSKVLRSHYHYLFYDLARSLKELDAASLGSCMGNGLALAPNGARQLLESFLAFRYPQYIGNFEAALDAAYADINDAGIKDRVNRYLNARSHLEQADPTHLVSPLETPVVLRGVFELIHAVDPTHFENTCLALGIDNLLPSRVTGGTSPAAAG